MKLEALSRRATVNDSLLSYLQGDDRSWHQDIERFFTPECDLKKAWLKHAKEMTALYASNYPGHRQTLWWKFSAPEPRVQVSGPRVIKDTPCLYHGVPMS